MGKNEGVSVIVSLPLPQRLLDTLHSVRWYVRKAGGDSLTAPRVALAKPKLLFDNEDLVDRHGEGVGVYVWTLLCTMALKPREFLSTRLTCPGLFRVPLCVLRFPFFIRERLRHVRENIDRRRMLK